MFRKVTIFITRVVVLGAVVSVGSVSLLDFASAAGSLALVLASVPASAFEFESESRGGFPVEMDLPQMDCGMTRKITAYGDEKLGELYLQIEEVMGRWAHEYPVTDEEKKEFEEVYAKSIPLRHEQRLIIFGSELLDGYVQKYCHSIILQGRESSRSPGFRHGHQQGRNSSHDPQSENLGTSIHLKPGP